jgi:hypothetical protein
MSMMQTVSQPSDLSPQDMRRYFNWPPPPPVQPKRKRYLWWVLLGIFISVWIGSQSSSIAIIVSVACMLAYIVYHVIKKQQEAAKVLPPAPTDQQYEDWVRSWQGPIRQYGMQKLGLDESDVLSRPLYVRSLVWPSSKWSKYYQSYRTPIIIKHGADGRPHSSINRYTFFYPTQHYIAVYIVDTNALDRVHFEGTRTYFYDDIVGVETSAIALNDGYVNYAMQHFELQVSNGQSVGATTYVHDLDVDQTVNALRTLLRDKKYGIQGGGYGYIGH